MHESSIKNFVLWYGTHFDRVHCKRFAEVGSLDINGSIMSILPEKIVGFDIVTGPRVDVVVVPGVIPDNYKGQFDAVLSANAFHLCGKPDLYRDEVRDLLQSGGLFCLTMCRPDCGVRHTTSQNQYGFTDGLRMTPDELRTFWGVVMTVDQTYIEGHDLVLWGHK